MYERFLPTFKVVEINNSTAHRIGHAISQVPCYEADVKVTEKNGFNFIENGIIVGLDAEYKLKNYDAAKHSQPCLVYNDELITGPIDTLDKYAEEIEAGKPAYVRALPLYLGDTFTTNNFVGTAADGYAEVVDGQLKLQSDVTATTLFIARKSTLPNREVAVEFTYVGKVKASA